MNLLNYPEYETCHLLYSLVIMLTYFTNEVSSSFSHWQPYGYLIQTLLLTRMCIWCCAESGILLFRFLLRNLGHVSTILCRWHMDLLNFITIVQIIHGRVILSIYFQVLFIYFFNGSLLTSEQYARVFHNSARENRYPSRQNGCVGDKLLVT